MVLFSSFYRWGEIRRGNEAGLHSGSSSPEATLLTTVPHFSTREDKGVGEWFRVSEVRVASVHLRVGWGCLSGCPPQPWESGATLLGRRPGGVFLGVSLGLCALVGTSSQDSGAAQHALSFGVALSGCRCIWGE